MSALRVGLISDTHGLLRSEAVAALAGSDLILHAGDVGGPEVLDGLAPVAPVRAVRGNVDEPGYLQARRTRRGPDPEWAAGLPRSLTLELEGVRVHVVHDLSEVVVSELGAEVVVCGHSHVPSVREEGEVLVVNPGSAGPRRFRLPVAVGRLDLGEGDVAAEVFHLPL